VLLHKERMTHEKPAGTGAPGAADMNDLVATLTAEEADRLGLSPSEMGDVELPEHAPAHVLIAGFRPVTRARLARLRSAAAVEAA
jgi:hypothetical protein